MQSTGCLFCGFQWVVSAMGAVIKGHQPANRRGLVGTGNKHTNTHSHSGILVAMQCRICGRVFDPLAPFRHFSLFFQWQFSCTAYAEALVCDFTASGGVCGGWGLPVTSDNIKPSPTEAPTPRSPPPTTAIHPFIQRYKVQSSQSTIGTEKNTQRYRYRYMCVCLSFCLAVVKVNWVALCVCVCVCGWCYHPLPPTGWNHSNGR